LCTEPAEPSAIWVHPCNCTLVAHESCLLEWIRSAQQDTSRARNALKCPQCGAHYEIESDNPVMLRLLNSVSTSTALAGRVVTVGGMIGIFISCGFGMLDSVRTVKQFNVSVGLYLVMTSYGAYAVQEFLGKEMYVHRIVSYSHYSCKLTSGLIRFSPTTLRTGHGMPSLTYH
jgi:uncharacterized protein YbaR (Trm112 family)